MLASIVTVAVTALPPSVDVDTSNLDAVLGSEAASRFHGELVSRLVEEGFAIGGEPDARLTFRVMAQTVVIEAASDEGGATARVPVGEAAILSLELVHRSALLVASLSLEHSDDGAYPDAAILDTTDVEDALPLTLGQLLVDAGYVLVGDPDAAKWRVCVAGREGGFAVAVVEADATCDQALSEAEIVDDPAARVEAALLAANWPETEAPMDEEEDTPVERSEPEPGPTMPPASPPPPRPRWRVGLGLFGGAQARLSAAEGLVGVVADAVHPVGFAILTRLTFAPSRGGADLRVFDTFAAAGVGFRSRTRGRVSLWAGALAGVAIHRYAFDGAVGHAADLDLELPLGLGVELTSGLDLTIDGLAAFVPRPIRHTTRAQTVWTRERWRVGGALGLRYTWAAGPRRR